jgi:hypothetical protein
MHNIFQELIFVAVCFNVLHYFRMYLLYIFRAPKYLKTVDNDHTYWEASVIGRDWKDAMEFNTTVWPTKLRNTNDKT